MAKSESERGVSDGGTHIFNKDNVESDDVHVDSAINNKNKISQINGTNNNDLLSAKDQDKLCPSFVAERPHNVSINDSTGRKNENDYIDSEDKKEDKEDKGY